MSTRLSIICIWVCFITLLILGIVMVASTGLCAHVGEGEDPMDFLLKQSIFACLGLAAALCVSSIDYHHYRNWIKFMYWVCCGLLVCCYLPVIGMNINGESRWINLVFITFQPSELAKSVLIITLAHWYTTHREVAGTFTKGFMLPGIIFAVPLALILFEKDMGTAAALAVSGFAVMFVAGARIWLLLLTAATGFLALVEMSTSSANRMERIFAWLNPEAHARGAGRQQWISQLSFENGGITGVGLGNSINKYGSLPFAHTDFIYAIVGEEWGFIGSIGVLLLFTLLTLAGTVLALQIRDTFGRLLAVGLVSTIFWPAALNMMVVTCMLPNTGLPLPFISYGGTNLVFTMLAIGILTSVQRHTPLIRQNYWPIRRLKDNK